MNRIKGFLDAKGINHTAFIAAVAVLGGLFILAAYVVGIIPGAGVVTVAAGSIMALALFLVSAFGLQFFLGGTGLDVLKIVAREPVALAYYVGALFISLAIVLKG